MILLKHQPESGTHCSQVFTDSPFVSEEKHRLDPILPPLQTSWLLWWVFCMPDKLLSQGFCICNCLFMECASWDVLTSVSVTSFRTSVKCCIISKLLYVTYPFKNFNYPSASTLSSIFYSLPVLHFSHNTYYYLPYYIFLVYVFIVWIYFQHTLECKPQEGRDLCIFKMPYM